MKIHIFVRYEGPRCTRQEDDTFADEEVTSMMQSQRTSTWTGLKRLSHFLQPWETWRWAIPFPPESSYVLRTPDTVRGQLSSILSHESRSTIDCTFWVIGLQGVPTRLDQELATDSWTEAFRNIAVHTASDQVRFVLVARQPRGEPKYQFLVLPKDLFFSGTRYFLFDDCTTDQTHRSVIACADPCRTEDLVGAAARQTGVFESNAVFGATPRDTERLFPGQEINLPTGTYIWIEPRPEEQLCVMPIPPVVSRHSTVTRRLDLRGPTAQQQYYIIINIFKFT